jgi:hypothetical protein
MLSTEMNRDNIGRFRFGEVYERLQIAQWAKESRFGVDFVVSSTLHTACLACCHALGLGIKKSKAFCLRS